MEKTRFDLSVVDRTCFSSAVTETTATSGIFTVTVTPTTAGILQLKINAGAVLKDVAGNSLNTTAALTDSTLITVQTQYTAWANAGAFSADANNDGVKNGLAWLLGASSPTANANSLLPKPTTQAGKLILTFRCLKTASRGPAVLKIQYTNDLGQADLWTTHQTAVPDATSTVGTVTFTNTADADPNFVNVRAEIPASAASSSGKIFARLYSSDN